MTDTQSFLSESLQRNERWIALADAKAGATLLIIPALTGLFGVPLAQHVREAIDVALDAPNYWALVGSVIYATVVGFAAWAGLESIYHAYRALSPQLKPATSETSVIFFKHITGQSLSSWEKAIEHLDDEQLQLDYARQVYETSRICGEKFDQVTQAMHLGAVFIVLSIIAYIPTAFW